LKSTGGHHPPPTVSTQPLSLRWNFSWIAAGNAVEMGCQWGLLVVLAHLGNLEMIGTVVLAFAICAPVYALACLGLRSALVSDARREYQFGDYLALRLVTSTLALAAIVALALTGGYQTETVLIILAAGLGELLKSISDIFHALLQQRERMDRIGVSLMLRGPLVLVLLGLGVYLTENILWAMLAFPLAAAFTLFCYDLPAGSRILRTAPAGNRGASVEPRARDAGLKPRWHFPTLLRLAWLTLPLGGVLMLITLTASLPRYAVSYYLGNRALGLFVSIYYLAMVGNKVVTAIGQSAGPRLAKYHAAGNTVAYVRLLGKLLGVTVGLGALLVATVALAGGPILGLLYDADFAPYQSLAVWLMLAGAMMHLTIPLGMAIEATRRFKTHMILRAVGVLVLLALLPQLIPTYNLQGAAVAMLIAFACTFAGCLGVVVWSVRDSRPSATEAEHSAPQQPARGRVPPPRWKRGAARERLKTP